MSNKNQNTGQLTLWLDAEKLYRFGKINWAGKGYPSVAEPKRIETGLQFCKRHAQFCNGQVVTVGKKVAVFK